MRCPTLSSFGSSIAVLWLAVGAAAAQSVLFRPPEDIINTAGCGDWPCGVSETDVAVGKLDVMAVWRNGGKDIAFSMRSSATLPAGTWSCPELFPTVFDTTGTCFTPTGTFHSLIYPSVAYSPATLDNPECYMACALAEFVETQGSDTLHHTCVVVSYYEPAATSPAWSPWMVLDMLTSTCIPAPPAPPFCNPNFFDKPFITAGAPDEFYVVYVDGIDGNSHYSHTTNGGRTAPTGSTSPAGDWICGASIIDGLGNPVGVGFAIQPTALQGDSDLFCIFKATDPSIASYGFVRGTDRSDTTVKFNRLLTGSIPPSNLMHTYTKKPWEPSVFLPGNPNAKYMPQIAAEQIGFDEDQNPLHQIYVVSHDVVTGNNVNAYLNVAVETDIGATHTRWNWLYPEPGVLLHDDPGQATFACDALPAATDQWLPILALDGQGRAHTIFYDDRIYDQDDGSPQGSCLEARYDLTHSVTTDQGATFSESPRPVPVGESAWLDYSFSYNGPRGYNGLDFTTKQGVTYLWATVCGTSEVGDPATFCGSQPSKSSVIWAQLIIMP